MSTTSTTRSCVPERLKNGWSRDRIVAEIETRGVPCCSENYPEKAFSPELQPPSRLPVAGELGETSIMFLIHPTLSEDDMDYVGCTARELIEQATA